MIYFQLFHGRTDPNQSLDDWGEQGPVFGPFDWYHVTYLHHIRAGTNDGKKLAEIFYVGDSDLVYYNGMYYGDLSVFGEEIFQASKELKDRHQEWVQERGDPPQQQR